MNNQMSNPILSPRKPFTKLLTDSTHVGITIRYNGSQASASITVAASTGNITFKHGAAGALAVDTNIQIGAGAGIIDTSNAAGNTMGAIVDYINNSTNWKAYLVDTLRADTSINTLATLSETVIAPGQDLELLKDTAVSLEISIRIGTRKGTRSTEEKGAAELYQITSLNTYASGTNLIQIYDVNEITKTETKVYELAGGATTASDTKSFVVNGSRGSVGSSKQGNHLLVRMVGSVACTGSLQVIAATAKGL